MLPPLTKLRLGAPTSADVGVEALRSRFEVMAPYALANAPSSSEDEWSDSEGSEDSFRSAWEPDSAAEQLPADLLALIAASALVDSPCERLVKDCKSYSSNKAWLRMCDAGDLYEIANIALGWYGPFAGWSEVRAHMATKPPREDGAVPYPEDDEREFLLTAPLAEVDALPLPETAKAYFERACAFVRPLHNPQLEAMVGYISYGGNVHGPMPTVIFHVSAHLSSLTARLVHLSESRGEPYFELALKQLVMSTPPVLQAVPTQSPIYEPLVDAILNGTKGELAERVAPEDRGWFILFVQSAFPKYTEYVKAAIAKTPKVVLLRSVVHALHEKGTLLECLKVAVETDARVFVEIQNRLLMSPGGRPLGPHENEYDIGPDGYVALVRIVVRKRPWATQFLRADYIPPASRTWGELKAIADAAEAALRQRVDADVAEVVAQLRRNPPRELLRWRGATRETKLLELALSVVAKKAALWVDAGLQWVTRDIIESENLSDVSTAPDFSERVGNSQWVHRYMTHPF